MTAVRVYCLPYAGGAAEYIYTGWQDRVSAAAGRRVEVVPLELPGRGGRMRERPVADADVLVTDVVQRILPWRETPFALFGHSLGGLLSIEVARVLEHRYDVPASAVVVSGAAAPGRDVARPADWLLPDAEFRERIKDLAGTPPEVLANDELMALFMPVLRADFAAAGRLARRTGRPVSAPISVFGGDRDPEVPLAALDGWPAHSTAECTVQVLPGDHFFLKERSEQVIDGIGRRLRAVEPALP